MSTRKRINFKKLIPTVKEYEEEFSFSEKEDGLMAAAQYKFFFGKGKYRFLIIPDYWKENWGRPPTFGTVNADDEFLAQRLASDRGLINPYNCSFGYTFKNIGLNKGKIEK
jgi:hypothetical protein